MAVGSIGGASHIGHIAGRASGSTAQPKRRILSNPLSYGMVVMAVVLIMTPHYTSFIDASGGELIALTAVLAVVHGWGFWRLREVFRRGLRNELQ
jgi:hypothetical protein